MTFSTPEGADTILSLIYYGADVNALSNDQRNDIQFFFSIVYIHILLFF